MDDLWMSSQVNFYYTSHASPSLFLHMYPVRASYPLYRVPLQGFFFFYLLEAGLYWTEMAKYSR